MDFENDVIGILGHAFTRNLLNTIECANEIQAEAEAPLSERQQADIDQIKVESNAMLEVIHDLMHMVWYDGIPAGRTEVEIRPFLEQVASVVQRQTLALGKDFTVTIEAVPGTIMGDAGALEKALISSTRVICGLSNATALHLIGRSMDDRLKIQIVDKSGNQDWVQVPTKIAFMESLKPAVLIEMLTWNRTATAFGGRVLPIGVVDDPEARGIEFRLPLRTLGR